MRIVAASKIASASGMTPGGFCIERPYYSSPASLSGRYSLEEVSGARCDEAGEAKMCGTHFGGK